MKKSPHMPPETFAAGFRRILPVYPAILILLGLAYYFALRTAFDYTIGHFGLSFAFGLVVFFTITGALFSFIPAYLAKYTVSVSEVPANNLLTIFGSVLAAVLAALLSVEAIRSFSPVLSVFDKLEAIALPFFAVAMIFLLQGKVIHRIAAIIAVISVNLHMFSCYFDPAVPINSPVRNLTIIMQAAALLFLLSEARLSFGVGSWRITVPFYIIANGTAAALGGGVALGGLLNRFLTSEPADPNLSLLRLGLYLALAIFAVGRLIALPAVCSRYIEPPKKDAAPAETPNHQ